MSGVKNIASRKTTPVTMFARPVRAPSPMPAPDSMNTVVEEDEVPPPTTAPTPSTTSADLMRGKLPFSSASCASRESPVMVPIASKKFVNSSVKTSMMTVTTPTLPKSKLTAPTRPRSGIANGLPCRTGSVRLQPPGFSDPSSANFGPIFQIASTITAMSVPLTSPMRMPPLTFFATRMPVSTSVTTKMTVGIVAIKPTPDGPSPTGGDDWPVESTKPEFTKPMNAMKKPMPTVIASLSCTGTASKIIRRRPVAASSTMSRPLMMTIAIASGQVTSWTTENARNALMPRPAANANGSRDTMPNRIVMTPAASAVAALTWPKSRMFPAMSSLPERMIGLRMTM